MFKSMKSVWSWSSVAVVVSCLSMGTACGPGDMNDGDDSSMQQQQPMTQAALQKCSTVSLDLYPPEGTKYNCSCATVNTGAEVHGVDLYSYSSDICAAGAHAGAIPLTGGNLTLTIKSAQSKFAGSVRNGITSTVLNAYQGSFSVAPKK